MSTIYASPGFKIALHHPSAGQTGLITAIFYAGQFAAFATISGRLSNYLGRRYAALTGVAVICAGAVLQTASVNVAMMVVGRIIAGAGSGIVSTAVPLYLSEVSPAEWRGMFVGLNQVGIVFGSVLSSPRLRQDTHCEVGYLSRFGSVMVTPSGRLDEEWILNGDSQSPCSLYPLSCLRAACPSFPNREYAA